MPIEYRDDHDVDLDQYVRLRDACAFRVFTRESLAAQIAGARWVVHAYDGERLVGFARAISDGVTTGYVSSVMVDPDYQRRGIGKAMIERIVAGRDHIKWVLHSRTDAMAFYATVGFGPASEMMIRDRRPK